ncbi:hypothetical protein PR048_002594 [Dryococelus australis]|uniref:Uncharacterized protein n=1 Tax=Dryococelus australis TaxID=614101 RepID=A0ABQ9IN09_9NEOP|nr:hypothetical protein PR048_002594 [Dryococelus australis]
MYKEVPKDIPALGSKVEELSVYILFTTASFPQEANRGRSQIFACGENVSDDAAGQRVFPVIYLAFRRCCILTTPHPHLLSRPRWHGKREIPEETRKPAALSGTIPTCENPGATPPGIEVDSSRWESRGHVRNASRGISKHGGLLMFFRGVVKLPPRPLPAAQRPEEMHMERDARQRRGSCGVTRSRGHRQRETRRVVSAARLPSCTTTGRYTPRKSPWEWRSLALRLKTRSVIPTPNISLGRRGGFANPAVACGAKPGHSSRDTAGTREHADTIAPPVRHIPGDPRINKAPSNKRASWPRAASTSPDTQQSPSLPSPGVANTRLPLVSYHAQLF